MEYSSKPRVAELIRIADGGMKEHYLTLVKGLIDSGIDVIALCGFSRKDRDNLKKWGATVLPFVLGGRINPIKDIFSILRLIRLLRKHKADIIHCHGFRAGMIGRIAAWLAGCQCIYTMHNFLPMHLGRFGEKLATWIERKLSVFTKSIIAVSSALKKEAVKVLGIDRDRVRVVYNGIDPPHISESGEIVREKWGINKEEKLVGTVARLIPSKGIDTLLDAASMVIKQNPRVKFMIVGDGPEESALKKKVKKLNYTKNIIFTGYSEYIWYYYEAFDIFVLPSLSEGLGISILEAMAMGKPVIASKTGGIGEIVKHDCNGYLVTPGDSSELADAILYYLSNPYRAQEYADKAKEQVNKKFHLKNMIRETSRIIFEVIDR